MKRAFCKSRTPTSKAQTGIKRVRQSLRLCQESIRGNSTSAALFYRAEDVCNGVSARFGAEIAFAVHADADGVGFHVALSDDKHGVHFHLLGALGSCR